MADNGYIGKIANAGTQKIQAPYLKKQGSGKATVKGGNGTDLRSGSTQKISK